MPVELDPDAALMLRVKQGDTAAFTALVEKYKQPVMNLAWRTLRDETEAEDLAQNVFVQAWKSADRYQATAKFSTWLFTIARNLCFNEIRRRSGTRRNRWIKPGTTPRSNRCIKSWTSASPPPRMKCCAANWKPRWTKR
jgi:DNA-directed RNA polymerase specialized sigma24 family protein